MIEYESEMYKRKIGTKKESPMTICSNMLKNMKAVTKGADDSK